jgi:hypothetical protein
MDGDEVLEHPVSSRPRLVGGTTTLREALDTAIKRYRHVKPGDVLDSYDAAERPGGWSSVPLGEWPGRLHARVTDLATSQLKESMNDARNFDIDYFQACVCVSRLSDLGFPQWKLANSGGNRLSYTTRKFFHIASAPYAMAVPYPGEDDDVDGFQERLETVRDSLARHFFVTKPATTDAISACGSFVSTAALQEALEKADITTVCVYCYGGKTAYADPLMRDFLHRLWGARSETVEADFPFRVDLGWQCRPDPGRFLVFGDTVTPRQVAKRGRIV